MASSSFTGLLRHTGFKYVVSLTAPMAEHISRRKMLRGLGAAIALPTLDAMLPVARAASPFVSNAASPMRIAFLFVPNGMNMDHWTTGGLKPVTRGMPD